MIRGQQCLKINIPLSNTFPISIFDTRFTTNSFKLYHVSFFQENPVKKSWKKIFYNVFQNFDSHQTNEDSLPCMYYNTFFTRHFHVVIRSYWIVILHFSWSISMTFLLLKVYRWNIHVYNHKIISRLILIFRNLPKTFPLPEKCLK